MGGSGLLGRVNQVRGFGALQKPLTDSMRPNRRGQAGPAVE